MGLTLYGKFDRLLLEAEVAPVKRTDFERQYEAAAGQSAIGSDHYQLQENKWGVEYRIYFDAEPWVAESLKKLGYHVEGRAGVGYRGDYSFRINNERLFWKLVEHGYRLGANGPIA